MTNIELKKIFSEAHRNYILTFKGLDEKLDNKIDNASKFIDKYQKEILIKNKREANEKELMLHLINIDTEVKSLVKATKKDVDNEGNKVS